MLHVVRASVPETHERDAIHCGPEVLVLTQDLEAKIFSDQPVIQIPEGSLILRWQFTPEDSIHWHLCGDLLWVAGAVSGKSLPVATLGEL